MPLDRAHLEVFFGNYFMFFKFILSPGKPMKIEPEKSFEKKTPELNRLMQGVKVGCSRIKASKYKYY